MYCDESNELLVNVLSPRVDHVAVKVRCSHCGTVNHWQRWEMRTLSGCDHTACACWKCDSYETEVTIGMADAPYLLQVMALDSTRR
jgi:hypothetical protein